MGRAVFGWKAVRPVALAAALIALTAPAGGGGTGPLRLEAPYPAPHQLGSFRDSSAALARRRLETVSWWGGNYIASTGEPVRVNVSSAYPEDEAVARGWAEFFAGLVHGSELALAEAFLAPQHEVVRLCGEGALGCYRNQMLVSIGDSEAGVAPALVAAHEYGHHVAYNRINPPWTAIDWGTKRWASASGICGRAVTRAVFPGDEGDNYRLNPGEGFAEAYRVLNDVRRGATAFEWPIVDASFFPDAKARTAIEEDVLRPWTAPTAGSARGRLAPGKKRTWSLPLSTPLDGELAVTLRMAADATHDLSLVDANGTRLAGGLWSRTGEKTLRYTVCGERALRIRVAGGGPSRFAVRWTRP